MQRNKVILHVFRSLHGQNTTPPVSFFSRGSFRPKKYFPTARFESYLLSLPPPSLSSSLPPFWSSRTNLYRARRGDGHATRARWCACLRGLYALAQGAFLFPYKAVRFPAARPLKKTRERGSPPSFSAPPFNPRLQPSPSSARRLLQRCDFWIFPLWEKLCKRIESTGLERWEKVIHAKIYLIHLNQYFAVYVSIGVNKSRKDSFFFSF